MIDESVIGWIAVAGWDDVDDARRQSEPARAFDDDDDDDDDDERESGESGGTRARGVDVGVVSSRGGDGDSTRDGERGRG
jgi:hypothetical protein